MMVETDAFERDCISEYQEHRIIMIYAIVGPPIGGVITHGIYWFSSFLDSGILQGSLLEIAFTLIGTLPAFMLLSYPFGGVQALLTGLLIKTIAGKEGRFGYLTAFLAAALVGIGVAVLLALGYVPSVGFAPIGALTILGMIGVGASLIIRYFFRNRFRVLLQVMS
ncbi:MAG: hypothetical protein CMI63_10840 [Parvularcula sp.]|nr:hypothetical protein [Parvularcula sp.]